jgi:hypothetical protein
VIPRRFLWQSRQLGSRRGCKRLTIGAAAPAMLTVPLPRRCGHSHISSFPHRGCASIAGGLPGDRQPPPMLSNRPPRRPRQRRRHRSAGSGARAERLAPVQRLGAPPVEAGPAWTPRLAVWEALLDWAPAGQQRLGAPRAPPPCCWPMWNWEGRSAERRRAKLLPRARAGARIAARL